MAESVRVYVRYETKGSDGITRRERNLNFGVPVPEIHIPDGCDYLWEWFFDISSGVDRAGDGYCCPITFSDYAAWERMTGAIVKPEEYAILRSMDASFVEEMNAEIKAERARLIKESGGK